MDTPMLVAIVLLPKDAVFAPAKAPAAHARLFPALSPITCGTGKGAASSFNVGPELKHCLAAHMPGPVPEKEASEAAALSPFVQGETSVIDAHGSHIIVTAKNAPDVARIEAMAALTRLVAAIAESSGAVGVYWGGGHVTHPAAPFIGIARTQPVPHSLWIGLGQERIGDEIRLLTFGMDQFEMPEHLVLGELEGVNPIEFLYDIVGYELDRAAALPPGDTIGRDDDEAFPVTLVDSPIKGAPKVLEIDLRGAGLA